VFIAEKKAHPIQWTTAQSWTRKICNWRKDFGSM